MTLEFWVTQTFNGLSYGALLFLLASGLSLIFGVMRVVNLAHGSYFMLGGYVGLSVSWRTGSYVLALIAGALVMAIVGVAMERVFLRRLPGQTLGQVLMTIGFALIFQDLALLIWGGDPYSLRPPSALVGADRVMIGSDFCFDMGPTRPREIVVRGLKLSARDRTRILSENARRLLHL